MGRSFASSSAKSVTTKRTMKIQNDQNPRRLALKFVSRRRFSGESRTNPSRGSAGASGAAAGEATGTRSRSGERGASFMASGLPRVKVDAGVDPRVGEVRDEVHHQADEGEDVEVREHHRVVAVDDRLEGEEPEPVEGEDGLDEQRSGEEGVDE